jgi:hypothetical protein
MTEHDAVLLIWDRGEGDISVFMITDRTYGELAIRCHGKYVNVHESEDLQKLYDLLEGTEDKPAQYKPLPWKSVLELQANHLDDKLILVRSGYA